MQVMLEMTAKSPLLMHNVRLASPLDPYAKQLKQLNSKRLKTDEDRQEIAHVEWLGGLYYDPDHGPVLPVQNVFKSLILGARLSKSGKKVERGVLPLSGLDVPLQYDGPRDLESLWGDGATEFVDIRPVKVQTNTIDRCRPIFRNWSAEMEFDLDLSIIELEEFQAIATAAGKYSGVGDYRLLYGKFESVVKEL